MTDQQPLPSDLRAVIAREAKELAYNSLHFGVGLTEAAALLERIARLAWEARGRAEDWQPIETAPKGSWLAGPNDMRHPDYVQPPHLWLLLLDKQRCVGSADAYYAEGGNGYDGDSYWVEEFSGERVRPTHWMALPPAPTSDEPAQEPSR